MYRELRTFCVSCLILPSVHNNAGILSFFRDQELYPIHFNVHQGPKSHIFCTGNFECVLGTSNYINFLPQCFHTFPQVLDLFHVAPGTIPRSSRYGKAISTKLPVHSFEAPGPRSILARYSQDT
jgi:hypothetical protein